MRSAGERNCRVRTTRSLLLLLMTEDPTLFRQGGLEVIGGGQAARRSGGANRPIAHSRLLGRSLPNGLSDRVFPCPAPDECGRCDSRRRTRTKAAGDVARPGRGCGPAAPVSKCPPSVLRSRSAKDFGKKFGQQRCSSIVWLSKLPAHTLCPDPREGTDERTGRETLPVTAAGSSGW